MEDTIQNDNINSNNGSIVNDILSKVDVNEVLQISIQLVSKEKTIEEIEKEYGPKYKAAALAYAESFEKEKISSFIKNSFSKSNNIEIQKLANDEYTNNIYEAGKKACKATKDFYDGKIDEKELFSILGGEDVKTTVYTFVKANGIDLNEIEQKLDELAKVPLNVAGYCCLMESYNIYMKALNDASIQHDKRVQVQQRCNASISAIRKYREEMENNILQYFNHNYDGIESGLMKMNEAILANDTDGYIESNVELQKLFGYKPQFKNQKEFDDLMDSEESFKL